jgi:hypothetical protein
MATTNQSFKAIFEQAEMVPDLFTHTPKLTAKPSC